MAATDEDGYNVLTITHELCVIHRFSQQVLIGKLIWIINGS